MSRTLHPHYSNRTLSLLFSLLLSLLPHLATSNLFIYTGCSQDKYQPNSQFQANLNSLLTSAATSASQASYNSFAIGNDTAPSPESAVYVLYQCRGDLKLQDCSKCIESAINQIILLCPYTYGASLQLDTCFLRYERVDFLGKLDTGLRYKKCSKSVSGDAEFFKRRDDVLDDLAGTVGFRVSNAGLVEGFGQCLGDLGPADCSACLSYAVGQLKSVCGSAVAADVYLGQCYAKYWASGYYNSDSNSSNEDEAGRTVAIIVGVLAGIAVVIVLLSVCRRALG